MAKARYEVEEVRVYRCVSCSKVFHQEFSSNGFDDETLEKGLELAYRHHMWVEHGIRNASLREELNYG